MKKFEDNIDKKLGEDTNTNIDCREEEFDTQHSLMADLRTLKTKGKKALLTSVAALGLSFSVSVQGCSGPEVGRNVKPPRDADVSEVQEVGADVDVNADADVDVDGNVDTGPKADTGLMDSNIVDGMDTTETPDSKSTDTTDTKQTDTRQPHSKRYTDLNQNASCSNCDNFDLKSISIDSSGITVRGFTVKTVGSSPNSVGTKVETKNGQFGSLLPLETGKKYAMGDIVTKNGQKQLKKGIYLDVGYASSNTQEVSVNRLVTVGYEKADVSNCKYAFNVNKKVDIPKNGSKSTNGMKFTDKGDLTSSQTHRVVKVTCESDGKTMVTGYLNSSQPETYKNGDSLELISSNNNKVTVKANIDVGRSHIKRTIKRPNIPSPKQRYVVSSGGNATCIDTRPTKAHIDISKNDQVRVGPCNKLKNKKDTDNDGIFDKATLKIDQICTFISQSNCKKLNSPVSYQLSNSKTSYKQLVIEAKNGSKYIFTPQKFYYDSTIGEYTIKFRNVSKP